MKIFCETICDLLPLYYDKVCSGSTRILVEEHLRECEGCRKELEKIKLELKQTKVSVNESMPLKKIAKVWKRDKIKSFVKGTITAALICAVLIGAYIGLTDWKFIPVEKSLITVSEVSQLADGRIAYHLKINDDKNLRFVKFDSKEDGSLYMTPMRSVIEKKRVSDIGLFNNYFVIDKGNLNSMGPVTKCYVGPENTALLLWEEGMVLPAASAELEAMFDFDE